MNVRLSPWKKEHVHDLIKAADNLSVWNTVRDIFPHPYTIDDAEEWIAFNEVAFPITNFAIEVDNVVAGSIGITLKRDVERKNAELGYWLGESFWGKGIATDAVRQFIPYVFSTFDIIRIYAKVYSNNPASMRVLAKNQFHQESIHPKAIIKNNQLLDLHVWAKRREGF